MLPQVDELDWLNKNPELEEISSRYPTLWEEAVKEIWSAANSKKPTEITRTRDHAVKCWQLWASRIQKSQNNRAVIKSALPHLMKSRMMMLALEKCYLAASSGQVAGKVRFSLYNGFIIQKLLFKRHLTPKLVSLRTFRFWWRFVTQRGILMPLLSKKGIYCFYSKELIYALKNLIAERDCLEIAAGNGMLSKFLREAGVSIMATDDFSWKSIPIDEASGVERQSAKQALEKYHPKVVICSWPPHNNGFEKYVFRTKSVELYIVIGSKSRMITGDWISYDEQQNFEWKIDPHLSNMVLPPENGNAIVIFQRKLIPKS